MMISMLPDDDDFSRAELARRHDISIFLLFALPSASRVAKVPSSISAILLASRLYASASRWRAFGDADYLCWRID